MSLYRKRFIVIFSLVIAVVGFGVYSEAKTIKVKKEKQVFGQVLTVADKIANKSASEKATIKGQEMAKIGSITKTIRSKYSIEVVSFKAIPNGVEVLARAWDDKGQIGFGPDGTVDIERFIIINPPILVDDPNGNIQKTHVYADGIERTRFLKEDLSEAILQVLEHTIFTKKQKFGSDKIIPGTLGNTTSTFYPDSGCPGTNTVDGDLRRTGDESFSSIRGGNGVSRDCASADDFIARLAASATSNQFANMTRGHAGFNTGPTIPSSDNISSVTFSFWPVSKTDGANLNQSIVITGSTVADNTTLAITDYQGTVGNTTAWAAAVDLGSIGTGAYYDFSGNASFIAGVAKGSGVTNVGVKTEDDRANSFSGTWSSGEEANIDVYFADQTGTTNDPKLVVEHAAATVSPSIESDLIIFE